MPEILELITPKILRAMEHAQAIDTAWARYVASQPFETALRPDSEHEYWNVTTDPPLELSLLAGEVFYQCRSALDHAFFELIKRNQRSLTMPDGWERQSEFPIQTRLPDGISDPPVPRHKFNSGARDWLSDKAFTHIEGLQPYNRTDEGCRLRILRDLANIDKHRRLNTVIVGAHVTEIVTTASMTSHTMGLMVKPGTQLSPLSIMPEHEGSPMHVKREIEPVMAFNEPTVTVVDNLQVQTLVHDLPLFTLWVCRNIDYLARNP